MIYTELNEHSFAYELSANKDNGFSYEGAKTLYNYLGDCEFEGSFDPVALRCQYSEFDEQGLENSYGYLLDDCDEDTKEEIEENWKHQVLMRELEDYTTVIEIMEGSYIIDTEF